MDQHARHNGCRRAEKNGAEETQRQSDLPRAGLRTLRRSPPCRKDIDKADKRSEDAGRDQVALSDCGDMGDTEHADHQKVGDAHSHQTRS